MMGWLLFGLMVVVFAVLALKLQMPVGSSLAIAALVGLAVDGRLSEWYHLVEGSLAYLDAILIIAAAMVFMRSLTATGRFQTVSDQIVRRFGHNPLVLLPLLMLVLMFPGMITGSSTAAVLTSGALVAPVLVRMGLDKVRVASIVAMGGIFGMVAPPVNLPVMIIGSGVDMPYTGFTGVLLALSFPLALVTVYILALPVLRRGSNFTQAAVAGGVPSDREEISPSMSLWSALVPILLVSAWMVTDKVLPGVLPPIGLPLLFVLGAGASFAMSGPGPWIRESVQAVRDALPVLSILVGVGMFIQIMTLVGVRGTLVVGLLGLPGSILLMAVAVGIPLFGAVSAYGSASVLGVPFILAFLGRDEILVAAALSLLASLGDLMPPTALAGLFAAQVVGVKRYGAVLKRCIGPALLVVAIAVAAIGWIA